MGKCLVSGCESLAKSKGMCSMHYTRFKRWGDPNVIKKMPNGLKVRQHPLYNSWRAMADRCLSPNNPEYSNYGGRGIKICDRWRPPYGFLNFVKDMGDKPSYARGKDGKQIYSLDRIDVNGNYCPENCRWATQSEQMNNTRRNRNFEAFGKTGTFTELFRLFAPDGLKKKTAERRFYEAGWPIELAITTLPWGRR